MKNIIQLIFLTLAFSCMVTRTYSQDPMYSVYWNDNAYLNPARVGEKQDAIYSFMQSRIQWSSIISRFHTFSGGLDIGLPTSGNGLGLRILSNVEGEGYQRTLETAFTYAHRVPTGENSQVSMALSAGFLSKTIDPTKLVFTDQLDPVYGNINPSAAPIGSIENASNINFSSGISFLKWGNGGKCDREPLYNVGIAVHNMTRPKLSLVNEQAQWPIRFTGYFEYNFMQDRFRKWGSYDGAVFSLKPSVLVATQRGSQGEMFRSFRIGTALYGRGYSSGISLAAYYKAESISKIAKVESAILILGLELPGKKGSSSSQSTSIFISHDYTLSGLKLRTGGVWEVGIAMKSCNIERSKRRFRKFLEFCGLLNTRF